MDDLTEPMLGPGPNHRFPLIYVCTVQVSSLLKGHILNGHSKKSNMSLEFLLILESLKLNGMLD